MTNVPIVDRPGTGWIPTPEEERPQNARYQMRPLLPREEIARAVRPSAHIWGFPSSHVLNQGSTGTCVGQACKGHMLSAPVQVAGPMDKPTAFDFYDWAIVNDPFLDNDPERDPGRTFGTTINAGMKAMRDGYGVIAEWRWAFDLQDILDWLAFKGPVVFGVDWFDGFFSPDAEGFINKSGSANSGHAFIVIGYDESHPRPHVVCVNSWGSRWGQSGVFRIALPLVQELIFQRNGDAAAALEVSPIPPPPPPPLPPPDPQGPYLGTNYQGWDAERGMWVWELELQPKDGWVTDAGGPYGDTQYRGFDAARNRFLWHFGIQPRGDWTP